MFVRRRGSHIFYTIGSQMAVNLSALRAGCPLHPGRFLVLISVRGWVDPGAVVRLEGLGQLKSPMTSTPLSSVLLGKATLAQLVKQFPAFYRTRNFIRKCLSLNIFTITFKLCIKVHLFGSEGRLEFYDIFEGRDIVFLGQWMVMLPVKKNLLLCNSVHSRFINVGLREIRQIALI
jgi:hypothetical protein